MRGIIFNGTSFRMLDGTWRIHYRSNAFLLPNELYRMSFCLPLRSLVRNG